MIEAVFLCDKQWTITIVRQCTPDLNLKVGDSLSELTSERWELTCDEEAVYPLKLTHLVPQRMLSAVVHAYKEGNLVVFANINNNQDFLEFGKKFSKYQQWAKDHLMGLFHNEYYLIQQMNNQLVDAKRQLMRSNRKLEQALKENKEVNEKLDAARILAERASRSKTRFLSNMSHDIRTPMNAIVGLTELMQHHLHEPELLEGYIVKLRSSSQYLLDLINDILDLSKIENGSLELKYEPMDISAEFERIMTMIRPQINKKKLILSVDDEKARYGWLLCDQVRFRQIFMNIFSNAIKYTPEGGRIQFTIREKDIDEQKRRYQFQIADSGIGMTPEFLEHIFDPFARAESSVRQIQGTGLGMAITKNIVDALEGTIQVESTLGKGSCFTICLPFEVCQPASEQKPDSDIDSATTMADTGGADDAFVTLAGKRFLCAEDNALNAEILSSMMELEGAECTIYGNGQLLTEAFETVSPGQYDAILMDVQMPVMNGYEATRQIRMSKNPLGKQIPIIAMTANAFSEDVQKCLDAGMDAHIAKPLDFEKLKEILGQLQCNI